MTAAVIDPAAPAADLSDAEALAAFSALATAKYDASDDPTPVVALTHEHEDDDAPLVAADAPVVPETPAAPAAVVPPAPAVPAAPAPAAAVTDIWSNATPELRAAHEAELALRDQKYRSDIGRQAAYQAKIKALEDAIAGKVATPAAATPSEAAPTTSLRENPAIKKSLEDYPEVVGPLLDALEPVVAENRRLGAEMQTISTDRQAAYYDAQEAALAAAHPDWVAACGSKGFADWLATQPAAIKQIVERNGEHVVNAEEAIAMVGNFKAHWALTHPAPVPPPPPVVPTAPAPTNLSERRAAQLAAVTATPKGAPAAIPDGAPGGDVKAMFDHFAQKKALKG